MDSFCDFQHKANSQDDGNPGHWDLALFVSGLNFYALDPNVQRNMVTMGLARFSLTKNIQEISENSVLGFFFVLLNFIFLCFKKFFLYNSIHCWPFEEIFSCKMPLKPFQVDLMYLVIFLKLFISFFVR